MKKLLLVCFLMASIGLQVLANGDSEDSILAKLEKHKTFVASAENTLKELNERIVSLEEKSLKLNLTCKVFKASSGNVSSGLSAVSVSVGKGYTLTGGGCSSSKPSYRKIVKNYPSVNSWNCAAQDHIQPASGSVTAHVIGCKLY